MERAFGDNLSTIFSAHDQDGIDSMQLGELSQVFSQDNLNLDDKPLDEKLNLVIWGSPNWLHQ